LFESDALAPSEEQLAEEAQRWADESQQRKKDILRTMEKGRYWVGEEEYTEYQRYYEAQRERLEAFFRFWLTDDEDKSEELFKAWRQAYDNTKAVKRDVQRIVEELTW
jgi:hypothetical protein